MHEDLYGQLLGLLFTALRRSGKSLRGLRLHEDERSSTKRSDSKRAVRSFYEKRDLKNWARRRSPMLASILFVTLTKFFVTWAPCFRSQTFTGPFSSLYMRWNEGKPLTRSTISTFFSRAKFSNVCYFFKFPAKCFPQDLVRPNFVKK